MTMQTYDSAAEFARLGFSLGRIFDQARADELVATETPFDRQLYSLVAAPEEIDHRGWLAVHDQGQMGSCSGQSATSCGEVLNYIATGGSVLQFSRMLSYLAGQKEDGLLGSDQGATITGSVRGMMKTGFCLEETFPYPSKYSPKIPADAVTEAAPHKIRKHAVLKSYADVYAWLATGIGVVQWGITWDQSWANCTGVMEKTGGSVYGGHALGLAGYSKRVDSQGRKYIWQVNSHGLRYANKGWVEVAPSIVDQIGRDRQAEIIGVTDLAAYGPREIETWEGMIG